MNFEALIRDLANMGHVKSMANAGRWRTDLPSHVNVEQKSASLLRPWAAAPVLVALVRCLARPGQLTNW